MQVLDTLQSVEYMSYCVRFEVSTAVNTNYARFEVFYGGDYDELCLLGCYYKSHKT
jgi:hypothetical protein